MNHRVILGMMLLLFALSGVKGAEFKFQVRHDHGLKSCRGELLFAEDEVVFTAANQKHSRTWSYRDIQQIGLTAADQLTLLTYEDRKLLLGKDRSFRFLLTQGTADQALWSFLQGKVTRPLVSDVIPSEIPAKYKIPVKHQRRVIGTEGFLEIAERYVIYRTRVKGDSRIWRYEEIDSIGSTGPYQLRITTMERVHGEIGGDKNYIFNLKERLAPEAYDFIWWKLNGPKISSVR